MASIINAGTSLGTALNLTTDTSGSLKLQTSGVDAISISSAQVVSLTNPLLPASGGTGITSLGTGVATSLGQNVTGSGSIALAASPTFTGTPLAPTAAPGTNTTQIATTAYTTAAITAQGLGTIATQNANAVAITGGTVTGITDLTVADGGTGVSTITANAVVLGNGTSAIQTVAPSTAGNILTSNGTTWTSAVPASYPLTSGTSQTAPFTAPNTYADFTGIPSWVKRVSVMFNAVSTNGTSVVQIQLGSGSVQTTGYVAAAANDATGTALTSGFPLNDATSDAAETKYGTAIFSLLNSNTWVCNGTLHTPNGNSAIINFAGGVTLSGALDRVRITTVNGTDTFDAGSINILYE
jgi:hypothetical protein